MATDTTIDHASTAHAPTMFRSSRDPRSAAPTTLIAVGIAVALHLVGALALTQVGVPVPVASFGPVGDGGDAVAEAIVEDVEILD